MCAPAETPSYKTRIIWKINVIFRNSGVQGWAWSRWRYETVFYSLLEGEQGEVGTPPCGKRLTLERTVSLSWSVKTRSFQCCLFLLDQTIDRRKFALEPFCLTSRLIANKQTFFKFLTQLHENGRTSAGACALPGLNGLCWAHQMLLWRVALPRLTDNIIYLPGC